MLYFTSDIHIGHANAIKLCKRPFNSLEDMEDSIVSNWNNIVRQDDEVIIVGDVAFKCDAYRVVKILKKLNGKKYLVIGNHDKKYLKDDKFRNCFEWIKDYYSFWHNKRFYVVGHYPFLSWDGMYRGSINLCGHRHLRVQEESGGRIDVGVDAWNFTPVSINDIEDFVNGRANTGFDTYFEQRMCDPGFAKSYYREHTRVKIIDSIVRFWIKVRDFFKWK